MYETDTQSVRGGSLSKEAKRQRKAMWSFGEKKNVAEKKHKIDLSTEDGHQYALMLWAQQPSIRQKWPELALLYHIENERQCSPQQAARRKRMGVKRGVPDLCLPAARHGYKGLYIELKKPGGRVSDEQKWWIGRLTGEGYFATASYGWEQAKAVLEWYLEKEAK